MRQSFDDTIIALSTPSGHSLRAILRISGPDAFHCVSNIFTYELPASCHSNLRKTSISSLESCPNVVETTTTFRSVNGYIAIKREQIHIPVTLYIMRSPHSFTKEDVVEIHTIGSGPIIEMILSEILFGQKTVMSNNVKENHIAGNPFNGKPADGHIDRHGSNNDTNNTLRLAEPGEFTKRAFLNGRIDITQAEAVIKMIRSMSDSEIQAGIALLKGEMRSLIDDLRDQLVDLCGKIEVSIDFADQDIPLIAHEEIENCLNLINNKLLCLISENKSERKVFAEGINVILYGRPNVGKSSLLNAFDPDIKTIVSDLPHTTRDSIKRTIKIDNVCFNFFDNPGIDIVTESPENKYAIAETDDIHLKSISKSQESRDQADIIIFVLDGSCELKDIDRNLFDKIKEKGKIVVINKCDLPQKINLDGLNNNGNGFFAVNTDAVNGKGITDLKKELMNLVLKGYPDQSGLYLMANARQKMALNSAANFIDYAIKTTKSREGLEFIALDLRNSLDALGEIAGNVIADDILDKIFSEFCIGK